jgi:hypothetical protein
MEQNQQPRFRADLFISYFANGQKHFSKRKTAKKSSRAAVKADIEKKYPKKKITLYYNPHLPNQSVFEPGIKSYWLLVPILAGFLLYVGMISYSWPIVAAILIVAIAGGLVLFNFFVAFGGYYYPDADVWDDIEQWLETYILGPPPISPSTVSAVRRRSGRTSAKPKVSKQPPEPARPVSQMTTRERNAEMTRQYNQGAPVDAIAKQFNMTRFAAMAILRSQRRAAKKHSSEGAFLADIAEIEEETGIPSQEPVKPAGYFCKECGARYRSTAKFCAQCGTRTSRKEPVPAQLVTPVSVRDEIHEERETILPGMELDAESPSHDVGGSLAESPFSKHTPELPAAEFLEIEALSDDVFTEEPATIGVAESVVIERAPPIRSLGLASKPGMFTQSISAEMAESSLHSPIPESAPKATTPAIPEGPEITTPETTDQPSEPSMEPSVEEKESWFSSIQNRSQAVIFALADGMLGITPEDAVIEAIGPSITVEPLMEHIDAEKQSLFACLRYRVREISFKPDDHPTSARIIPYSGPIKQITVTFNQKQVLMSGCLKRQNEVSVNLELATLKELEQEILSDPWKAIALTGEQDVISAIKLRTRIARRMISLGDATALVQSPAPGKICLQVISNESEDVIRQCYELLRDLQSFFHHSRLQ